MRFSVVNKNENYGERDVHLANDRTGHVAQREREQKNNGQTRNSNVWSNKIYSVVNYDSALDCKKIIQLLRLIL